MQTYAKDFCLREEMAVPNGVKPSVCIYSGFFLLRFLLPKVDNTARLKEMTTQFCTDHLNEFPSRTAVVSKLRIIYNDLNQDFGTECIAILKNQ